MIFGALAESGLSEAVLRVSKEYGMSLSFPPASLFDKPSHAGGRHVTYPIFIAADVKKASSAPFDELKLPPAQHVESILWRQPPARHGADWF